LLTACEQDQDGAERQCVWSENLKGYVQKSCKIRYSGISLSRKTTNQRDVNKLSYFRKTAAIKELYFTKTGRELYNILKTKILYVKYEDLVRTSQKTQHSSARKIDQQLLCREIHAPCLE